MPTIEFAYNSSTRRSPFEIMLGVKPRQLINLIFLSISERFSQEADSFAKHLFDVRDEVRRTIALSNGNYKARVDFSEGMWSSNFSEGMWSSKRVIWL